MFAAYNEETILEAHRAIGRQEGWEKLRSTLGVFRIKRKRRNPYLAKASAL